MRFGYALAIAALTLAPTTGWAGCAQTGAAAVGAPQAQRDARQDAQQARSDRAAADVQAAQGNFGSSAADSAAAQAERRDAKQQHQTAQIDGGAAAADCR